MQLNQKEIEWLNELQKVVEPFTVEDVVRYFTRTNKPIAVDTCRKMIYNLSAKGAIVKYEIRAGKRHRYKTIPTVYKDISLQFALGENRATAVQFSVAFMNGTKIDLASKEVAGIISTLFLKNYYHAMAYSNKISKTPNDELRNKLRDLQKRFSDWSTFLEQVINSPIWGELSKQTVILMGGSLDPDADTVDLQTSSNFYEVDLQ